jgi:hypothetical protein
MERKRQRRRLELAREASELRMPRGEFLQKGDKGRTWQGNNTRILFVKMGRLCYWKDSTSCGDDGK